MISTQLLIVLEQWPSFGEASARLKALSVAHGAGALMRRSDHGFAVLATPAYVLRLAPATAEPTSPSADPQLKHAGRRARAPRPAASGAEAPLPVAVPGTYVSTAARTKTAALHKTSRSDVQAAHLTASPPRAHRRADSGQPRSRRNQKEPGQRRTFGDTRARAMADQLLQAFRTAPAGIVEELLGEVVKYFGVALARRVGNVIDLGVFILGKAGNETIGGCQAFLEGRGIEHLSSRAGSIKLAALRTLDLATTSSKQFLAQVRAQPREFVPRLMMASLAFYAGSGGLDGDGGIADTDLELFGIGGHRSIFTHSIVAGAAAETALFGLVLFVRRAHSHLPRIHDPLWDEILRRSRGLGEDARQAMSAGLAYHLAIDTLVEPSNYADLPFSAPEDVHQFIAGSNAAAEAGSVKKPAAAVRSTSSNAARLRGMPVAKPSVKDVAVGGALAVVAWVLGFA